MVQFNVLVICLPSVRGTSRDEPGSGKAETSTGWPSVLQCNLVVSWCEGSRHLFGVSAGPRGGTLLSTPHCPHLKM